jgi:NAD(P) transhydrogenase subunit alpha
MTTPDAAAGAKALVVGVPKEIFPGERRVAASPATVERLRKRGLEVVVETGAGDAAGLADAAFAEAGARIVPSVEDVYAQADIVTKVRGPMEDAARGRHEATLLREGQTLVSFLWPAQNPELVAQLVARKATVLAMDAVPRITRAQKLDALSAMANLVGYRAVIEAASHYGRFLGGQTTAAGRVRPATVFIVGAGVAGLAAVAAARSLGAIVRAFDTRPVVREQVESLGGEFVPFEFSGETGEGTGGYAKEVSDAYLHAEQQLLAKECERADIVVTTALIPGKPAPQLITSGAVVAMRPGSVIVDLAAEQGGNCALTERDAIVEKHGVTIVGRTDFASRMALMASELYATTVLNLLEEVLGKGTTWKLDREDEIQRGMLVIEGGELLWPPPRPTVRAGAPTPPPAPAKKPAARGGHGAAPAAPSSPWPAAIGALLGVALLIPIGLFAPPALVQHLTVFLLACVVGWHVVWNVTPALHTPLMSVTNAISGIILIGGLLLARGGRDAAGGGLSATVMLGAVAVLLAAINVAGGFLVTQRMLRMFRR